jgi:putative oxidoreductase
MGGLQMNGNIATGKIDAALMLVRLASAMAFLYHGAAITFGMFGGPGPAGFAGFTHTSLTVAYLVGLAQLGGGLAMLTGVFIRVGAVCIIIVMIGAIFMVHLPHGFDISKGGVEYVLTQSLVALALFLTGPGAYSLAGILPESLRKL